MKTRVKITTDDSNGSQWRKGEQGFLEQFVTFPDYRVYAIVNVERKDGNEFVMLPWHDVKPGPWKIETKIRGEDLSGIVEKQKHEKPKL